MKQQSTDKIFANLRSIIYDKYISKALKLCYLDKYLNMLNVENSVKNQKNNNKIQKNHAKSCVFVKKINYVKIFCCNFVKQQTFKFKVKEELKSSKQRIILHVDANSFYASVECAHNPNLQGKPVAVSGDPSKRNGIILAKNEIAKRAGVLTGEAIWQAKEKCFNLICLPPRMPLYEKYSEELRKIYKKYTHLVEPFGIDECWMDVTDTQKLFGGAMAIAEAIRSEVKQRLKITVSIGISFCKLFAKLGSDLKKPDAITSIPRENFKQIVYPLPITDIIGIGHRLEKRFNKLNVYKLGEITTVEDFVLKKNFGIIAIDLKQKLLGFDIDQVANSLICAPPKSVGNGTTTTYDIFLESEIRATVIYLAREICPRLRAQELFAGRIAVSIKNCQLKTEHHSRVLPFPTHTEKDVVLCTMQLINSFWRYNEKIRAVRISVSNLSNANVRQLSFFNTEEKKKDNLNVAIDYLSKKHGKKFLQPAIIKASPFLREGFQLHRPTQA